MSGAKTTGRRPVKQQQILSMIRDGIRDGTYLPGDQLPTRAQLEQQIGCSSVTLQRALDILIAEGSVVVHGKQGTYVADSPPSLCLFYIVFSLERGSKGWVRFWSALEEQARLVGEERGIQFRFLTGMNGQTDQAPYQELEESMRAKRLAGVIFTSDPYTAYTGAPIVNLPDTPRVAITARAVTEHTSVLKLDVLSFYGSAFQVAHEAGCSRVGMLLPPGHDRLAPLLIDQANQMEMTIRTPWIQIQAPALAQWAAHQVELMFDRPEDRRPDCLIVGDDNLLDASIDGIQNAGLTIGKDVELISHSNFPASPMSTACTLIGYDARTVLSECLDMLDVFQHTGRSEGRSLAAHIARTPQYRA